MALLLLPHILKIVPLSFANALAASTSRHCSVLLQPHPLRTHECKFNVRLLRLHIFPFCSDTCPCFCVILIGEPRVPANASSCLYTQLGNDAVTTGMPTTSVFGRSMGAYAGASTSTPGMSSTSVFGDVTAACATPSTITRRCTNNVLSFRIFISRCSMLTGCLKLCVRHNVCSQKQCTCTRCHVPAIYFRYLL